MKCRIVALAVISAFTYVGWLGSAAPAAQAQASGTTAKWKVPRTAWGDPDLQGKWSVAETGTPEERPKEMGTREFLTEKELADKIATVHKRAEARARREAEAESAPAAAPAASATPAPPAARSITDGLDRRVGTYNSVWMDPVDKKVVSWNRTSLVVDPPDGRYPPLTPEAIKRLEQREAGRRGRGEADTWEDRNLSERCMPSAFWRFLAGIAGDLSVRQIIQAPGYAVIVVNAYNSDNPIIVPLDNRPRPGDSVRSWAGVPRGHWEGDTLVVETTHFNNKQDGGSVLASHLALTWPNGYIGSGETLRIIERFTRTGPDLLEYRYTIDDPKTYVRPYTVLRPLSKQSDDLLVVENACHEGNYGIVGQLSAARADEKYAMEAAEVEVKVRQGDVQEMKQRTEEWNKTRGASR